jgi:UDP-N-acetylglucosamine 3-dehydrogenase
MTLRVALVGCGSIGRSAHLPGLRAAGADVVVFASRTMTSASAAASDWGAGDAVTDWRAAVSRDDVDAVVVCTPNSLHAEIAVAAAEAGKHVLVEKPMGCTVDECDRMVAAASSAGVVLMPAQSLRFAPPLAAARAAVAAGQVGTVTAVRAALGHSGPQTWSPSSAWFRDPDAAGGGALLDLGVHVADLVRAVLADEVVEVTAFVSRSSADAVEESGMALLRFAGGAVGSLHASWALPQGEREHVLTVFGTEGVLHVDGRTPPAPSALAEAPADDPSRAFVRAVVDGEEPAVTGADGRAAVAIIEAAYESAATGKAVAPR